MRKNKNISEHEKLLTKLLTKYDLNYIRNVLTLPKTAFIVSLIACIVDGMTVYRSIDRIMKGNFMLTLLMTITAAAVLDMFPGYFPIAVQRMKYYNDSEDEFQEKIIKIALFGGIMSFIMVFTALCIVRSANIEFILSSQFEREALYQASNKRALFQPSFSGVGAQSIVIFMDVLNLGTSLGVFLASLLTTPTEKENTHRKKYSMGLDVAVVQNKKQYEVDQLLGVIDTCEASINNTKSQIGALKTEAVSQGNIEKVKAREALESVLGDSDVSDVITKSSEDIVSSEDVATVDRDISDLAAKYHNNDTSSS